MGETPPPWPWALARWCLDLQFGGLRHFPAGSYDRQVATQWGNIELELIDLVGRVRELYLVGGPDTWTAAQIDLAAWIEKPDG